MIFQNFLSSFFFITAEVLNGDKWMKTLEGVKPILMCSQSLQYVSFSFFSFSLRNLSCGLRDIARILLQS